MLDGQEQMKEVANSDGRNAEYGDKENASTETNYGQLTNTLRQVDTRGHVTTNQGHVAIHDDVTNQSFPHALNEDHATTQHHAIPASGHVPAIRDHVTTDDVNVGNDKNGGGGLLSRYGCSTVSLFRGGGLEAKFEDGAMIHLAPCSSSFLLQLPPHRDTPYGCGLHKIEYKTKFPTSLCRDKVRHLIQLKNKLNNQHRIYLSHADVITASSSTTTARDVTNKWHPLPFDPNLEDGSAPIKCLYGKKLPRHIEDYNWQYVDMRKHEDGSLSLWDTNQTVLIVLKPHRQTFLVTFLAPKRKTDAEIFGPKGDVSFTSSTPRVETSREEKLEFVATTPRYKSVTNKTALESLKCNLSDKLTEMDQTVVSSSGESELGASGSGVVGRKANWHQYVWVSQLQSVVCCDLTWKPAIDLMLDYCRHSFLTGLSNSEEEASMTSSSIASSVGEWVLEESCCSAYLHPWRVRKGYMESRDTTDLWTLSPDDNSPLPLETFVTDNFTFRILETVSSEEGGRGCLLVEVDLPDGSLLRSEFDQFSPQKKPDLFIRFQFNTTMQNVKSVTISLSNPPPKLPGRTYDLAQVAQQAADLLASVRSTVIKHTSSTPSCVKKSLERAQDDLSLINLSLNSPKPMQPSASPSVGTTPENTYPCGTPRNRFMGPYVTEQTQVEGVGEFWAYSTGRVRVAFVDGVFLDMKLLSPNLDSSLMSSAGTPRSVYDSEGMITPRRSMSSSTSAADLPPGLARMLMKDGTYQFVNVFNPPSQYTRYVLAASEWCSWVACPESERQEAVFTSENYINVLVQSELTKIRNYNYMKENAPNFHNLNKRPDPVGGVSPNQSSSQNDTLTANQSATIDSDSPQLKNAPQSKVSTLVPPIAIDDVINSSTQPRVPKIISSQCNKENVAITPKASPSGGQFSDPKCFLPGVFEKPMSQANERTLDRSSHAEQASKSSKTGKYDTFAASTSLTSVKSPKWSSGENSGNLVNVSSASSKTTDEPLKTDPESTQKQTSAQLKQLKKSSSLESTVNANSVTEDSRPDNKKADGKTSKDKVKVQTTDLLKENAPKCSPIVEKRPVSPKVLETQYKQSELQSEIQRIIQKTRQDLEHLQSPNGSEKLFSNPDVVNESETTLTTLEPKSKHSNSAAESQRNGEKSRTPKIDQVFNGDKKSINGALFPVPPPMEFSEGAQQMQASSAYQNGFPSAVNQSQANISLLSRPKSPPVELQLMNTTNEGDSSMLSPPRSPPARRKPEKEPVASASSALMRGATSGVKTGKSESISGEKITESNANHKKDESRHGDEHQQWKVASVRESSGTKTNTSSHKSTPNVSIIADQSANASRNQNFDNPEKSKATLRNENHRNVSSTSRKDLMYMNPKQLKEAQNSSQTQNPKVADAQQNFNTSIDDVDKFINENSAGLDVQFDFASVTDALFKTQQAIKTIENMLEKSGGVGAESCSHPVPEVSSLNGSHNHESSNES